MQEEIIIAYCIRALWLQRITVFDGNQSASFLGHDVRADQCSITMDVLWVLSTYVLINFYVFSRFLRLYCDLIAFLPL